MSGLISALKSGRLDPYDANFEPIVLNDPHKSGSDWREHHRRMRRRFKRIARFARLREADDREDLAEQSPF